MSLVEGTVGGVLVANQESEILGDLLAGLEAAQTGGLEADSAKTEHLIVEHFFNEDLFGGGGGSILALEAGDQAVEVLGILDVLDVWVAVKPWEKRLRLEWPCLRE